jgi:hypothetical protein
MLGPRYGVACSAFIRWEMWCRRCKLILSIRSSLNITQKIVVSVLFRSDYRCDALPKVRRSRRSFCVLTSIDFDAKQLKNFVDDELLWLFHTR